MAESKPAAAFPERSPEVASPRNTRNGLILFAVYVVLYSSFVLLNAFARERMAVPVLAGINLAIVYGMGLILAAFALALVYLWLCREPRPERGEEGRP